MHTPRSNSGRSLQRDAKPTIEKQLMTSKDLRPIGARVTEEMVGSTTGLTAVSWDERDTILYALGVGAGLGAPEAELHFTTENTGDIALRPVPSMVTILAAAAPPPALAALDIGRFLHAEQRFELLAPLPPTGTGFVRNMVASVEDKGLGTGAIYNNTATLYADAACETVLARSGASIYVMGGGGFGGPRPEAAAFLLPDRAPDFNIIHETRPEQALLYRLSGDRHRLHSDPAFARERNFPRPILHGLCTYGFACRAVIAAMAGSDFGRLASMSARFVKPVFPGDTLTTLIWHAGNGEVQFRMSNAAGESVLERGNAHFRPR